MDLTPETMILTSDGTIMYTNIQTCPALNQIAQYLDGNKKILTSPILCYAQGSLPYYEKQNFPFWLYPLDATQRHSYGKTTSTNIR